MSTTANQSSGYKPPNDTSPIDLRAPKPRVKRLNRVAIGSVVAGLGILIAFALLAALREPAKTPVQNKTSTQLVLPSDALNDIPGDYATAAAQRRRDVPKLGNPISGEFGAAQLQTQNELAARAGTRRRSDRQSARGPCARATETTCGGA